MLQTDPGYGFKRRICLRASEATTTDSSGSRKRPKIARFIARVAGVNIGFHMERAKDLEATRKNLAEGVGNITRGHPFHCSFRHHTDI
ncbi:hypothetical protein OPV22_015866 [Ensete ventricosum]|uniref:Uncharacterized protein n=1 Tax=Ensete ventricosum TaxID=4639 RepID=A0AAV8R4T4_ENSVE|nr:hypothetical protein OPV22_015866 [Ensete ventricosum]